MHFQVVDDNTFSRSPLTLESREWLASEANKSMPGLNFTAADVIKIPRRNGQFDLYILSKTEVLGSGSNSQISKAYPLSMDGEVNKDAPIAVKFVSHEKEAVAVEGLDRESFALKQLDKMGARLEAKEGSYLLMPFYTGKKIVTNNEEKIELATDFSQITPIERLSLLSQLGEQVQALHDKKLIHGDIQPANILFSKGKDNAITLQLIDFDQSRPVNNLDELATPQTVNMTFSIRAPEIMQKQIGAASDIYALGLNFLFLLGQPDPFIPAYDTKFVHDLKKEYLGTQLAQDLIQSYLKSDDYKKLPANQKGNAERQYRAALADKEYPVERLEKLWLEKIKPARTEIVNFEALNIPLEIAGISVRLAVKNFLERMLSETPATRPHIDEVNNFIRGVIQLINNPSIKIQISDAEPNKWEKAISELGKKHVEEKKEEPVKPLLDKTQTPPLADKQKDYRVKLAVLLDGMKNIDGRINAIKSFLTRHSEKSKDRIDLEKRLKGIADLYDANSSKNPYRDYQKMVAYINSEIYPLLREQNQLVGSNKLKALQLLLKEADNATSVSLKSSSSNAVVHLQNSPKR